MSDEKTHQTSSSLTRRRCRLRARRSDKVSLAFREKREAAERKGREVRRGRMKSLIYAPDKKTRNSIRPPKSVSSIFVVRNVVRLRARCGMVPELPVHTGWRISRGIFRNLTGERGAPCPSDPSCSALPDTEHPNDTPRHFDALHSWSRRVATREFPGYSKCRLPRRRYQ